MHRAINRVISLVARGDAGRSIGRIRLGLNQGSAHNLDVEPIRKGEGQLEISMLTAIIQSQKPGDKLSILILLSAYNFFSQRTSPFPHKTL